MSEEEGIIIEYRSLAGSVKVTAFDPITLTEVSIIGAPSVARKQLAELAIRKLRYVLEKDGEAGE